VEQAEAKADTDGATRLSGVQPCRYLREGGGGLALWAVRRRFAYGTPQPQRMHPRVTDKFRKYYMTLRTLLAEDTPTSTDRTRKAQWT
jgi:hypothetical protein